MLLAIEHAPTPTAPRVTTCHFFAHLCCSETLRTQKSTRRSVDSTYSYRVGVMGGAASRPSPSGLTYAPPAPSSVLRPGAPVACWSYAPQTSTHATYAHINNFILFLFLPQINDN
eukprot:scaffold140923_cov34-Tisochrysis_lutea.AAC.5